MVETLAFRKIAAIDLTTDLEKISSTISNRILKLEDYTLQENQQEQFEIIIFKGFSISSTYPIRIDFGKKIIKFDYKITNFKLYEAPLIKIKKLY